MIEIELQVFLPNDGSNGKNPRNLVHTDLAAVQQVDLNIRVAEVDE